jgi:parallel beta-helix repeat protein
MRHGGRGVATRVALPLASLAALALLVVGPVAAAPSPADSDPLTASGVTAPWALTSPFALGEVDLSALGVSAAELANVGVSSAASSSGDGPNMWIVDDNMLDCPNAAFTSIQAAVTAAGPGDQVKVCPGTYTEQVVIGPGKDDLRLFSQVPLAAVIQAPLLMALPKSIVLVDEAQDVTIRHFTISGPFTEAGCTNPPVAHTGIRVIGGGSAVILHNHITRIRDANPALFGCQDGLGILVGRQFEGQTGTAWILHNRIDLYQKAGIVADNEGSFVEIRQNEIVGEGPTSITAQNGVQISRGADAEVHYNRVSRNLYTPPGVDATGFLLFQLNGGVAVHHNESFENDTGFYLSASTLLEISHNNATSNTDKGIYAEAGASNNLIAHNKALGNLVDCRDDPPTDNQWIKNFGNTEVAVPGPICKRHPVTP